MSTIQEQILVIGGGRSDLYSSDFFEVGNHPTSNFGKDKDWRILSFWIELDILLDNHKFKGIIFDNGSESWLYDIPTEVFDTIMLIIVKHIYDEGIIITIGKCVRSSNTKILDNLLAIGFNNIGILRFGPVIDDNIFNILSLSNAEIIDKTNIYQPCIDIGTWDPRGFVVVNPEFNSVIEKNQIEFIRNRLLF